MSGIAFVGYPHLAADLVELKIVVLGPDNIRIDFQRIARRANTDTVQMNELMEAQTEHSSKYG